MNFNDIDRTISKILPNGILRDTYTRGMRRLAEYGFFTKESVIETKYGFKMNAGRLDAIRWYIHYFGVFEPLISQAWVNILKPGDTVVDIGGNVGYHALLAGKCVGKSGTVLTFEPSTKIHSELLANISLNSDFNIRAKKVAISNTAGTVDFYFSGENAEGNSSIMSSHGGVKVETVSTISFTEIAAMVPLNTINLIKIDVEGAEGLVLAGLEPHLDALNPKCIIFLEISPENIKIANTMLQPFISKGFHIKQIGNEYTTEFYSRKAAVELYDLNFKTSKIQDIVLCKDLMIFDLLTGR
jgi:FkbM family methyltransferase